MTDTITIKDPELAKMFEQAGGPSMGDLPNLLALGITKDGRTVDDFEDREEFEYEQLYKSRNFVTLAEFQNYLDYVGYTARKEYLRILKLRMIFDKMTERANGDDSAKLMDLLNAHIEEHAA